MLLPEVHAISVYVALAKASAVAMADLGGDEGWAVGTLRKRTVAMDGHPPEPRAVPLQRRGYPSSLQALNSVRVHSPWSSGEGSSLHCCSAGRQDYEFE